MVRFSREQLRCELERLAHVPIRLTLTANASSYISFRPHETPRRVRLQRVFLYAPDEVLVALGRWIGGRQGSCPKAVRRFIDFPPPEAMSLVRTRRRRLRTRGRCYDLGAMFERVNQRFFQGAIASRITWGRGNSGRTVQARTLGAYYRQQSLIVIQPVLDQWEVPEWFVEFTIYHECLHTFQTAGQRPHGREFMTRLHQHPDHVAALKWEKANLRLLTRGRGDARRLAAWQIKRPTDDAKRQLTFDW
jgi:hypothetical protein